MSMIHDSPSFVVFLLIVSTCWITRLGDIITFCLSGSKKFLRLFRRKTQSERHCVSVPEGVKELEEKWREKQMMWTTNIHPIRKRWCLYLIVRPSSCQFRKLFRKLQCLELAFMHSRLDMYYPLSSNTNLVQVLGLVLELVQPG